MNQLKGVVHQKNKEIVTGRIAIGALLVICLVLCAIIATSPNRLMIYSPPTQQAASLRPWWEIPKTKCLRLCLPNLPTAESLDGKWRGRIQSKY